MAENRLGEGGSCCSVMPGPLPALHSSFPQTLHPLSREQEGSLPGQVLPPGLSWLQQGHVHSEPRSAGDRRTSLYSCHVFICISCDKRGKRLLVSPCQPSCHGASREMLKCWQQWGGRGVMAGQRGSFSSSTSPGHLHSLVIVMGTWGFFLSPGESSCPPLPL